jgi:phosphoenolpyruvate carboxykinase (GTP)
VLKWIAERLDGTAAAIETPIGRVPTPESLDLSGLNMSAAEVEAALAVSSDEWREEIKGVDEWFEFIGPKVPSSLRDELESLRIRLA